MDCQIKIQVRLALIQCMEMELKPEFDPDGLPKKRGNEAKKPTVRTHLGQNTESLWGSHTGISIGFGLRNAQSTPQPRVMPLPDPSGSNSKIHGRFWLIELKNPAKLFCRLRKAFSPDNEVKFCVSSAQPLRFCAPFVRPNPQNGRWRHDRGRIVS